MGYIIRVSYLLGGLCAKKVPLDKGWEKDVCGECTLEKRVQRPHNCTAAAGGEILFMAKRSPVLCVVPVIDDIQGPAAFSKDKNQTVLCVCDGDGVHSGACYRHWQITCHEMRDLFCLLTTFIFLITGIPKDGHKEERRTA